MTVVIAATVATVVMMVDTGCVCCTLDIFFSLPACAVLCEYSGHVSLAMSLVYTLSVAKFLL